MSLIRAYGGGAAVCVCGELPHADDCPAKPAFDEDQRLTLDEEPEPLPFWLECPRCLSRFPQTKHTLKYEYTPTEGMTEQSELPLVCPFCGHSDKQTLPVMVGYNPFESVEDDAPQHFKILCPANGCGWSGDRTEGVLDIWLEKAVVKGCVSMYYQAHNREYLKGEVYAEYTALTLTCPWCGHSCGEDE